MNFSRINREKDSRSKYFSVNRCLSESYYVGFIFMKVLAEKLPILTKVYKGRLTGTKLYFGKKRNLLEIFVYGSEIVSIPRKSKFTETHLLGEGFSQFGYFWYRFLKLSLFKSYTFKKIKRLIRTGCTVHLNIFLILNSAKLGLLLEIAKYTTFGGQV